MINILYKLFHIHKFKKEGDYLICECGKYKKLECNHVWEEQYVNHYYEDDNTNGRLPIFKKIISKCKKCGKHVAFKY